MVFELLAKLIAPSRKILRNQMQYLFLIMLIVVIPFLVKFVNEFNNIVEMRRKGNEDYPWPKYTDLYKALATTAVLIVLYIPFVKLFENQAEKLISLKYQGNERKYKTEKIIDCIFKGAYYLFSSILAYIAIKDTFFLSPFLGGKGSTDNMFFEYPYQNIKGYELICDYIMIQLGYHFFSLLQHLYKEPKNDFIEMLLHHVMTVSLVGLAYYMNYVTMSSLVLFVHDVSDVFGYLVRIFVDTNYKMITLSSYIGLLISWFYMRLVIFPFDLIRVAVYVNPMPQEIYGMGVLGGMLHFLLILHIYWYYLFIKIGLKFLATKETEDTYHVE